MTPNATIVAWDFDGVLNRNIVDGRFIWADRFEQDIGHSRASFDAHVFGDNLLEVVTGRQDLRDRVQSWANKVGCKQDADALLDYWFNRDALPDPDLMGVMETLSQRGIRQVIATNNESRRTAFIEHQMGFAARVEHVFASGRIGFAKPDAQFFNHVTEALSAEPSQMLLIDDLAANTQAAARLGWSVFHYTPDSTHELIVELLNGLAD